MAPWTLPMLRRNEVLITLSSSIRGRVCPNTAKLKAALRQIDPNDANLVHGRLLLQEVETQHHLGTLRCRQEAASIPSTLPNDRAEQVFSKRVLRGLRLYCTYVIYDQIQAAECPTMHLTIQELARAVGKSENYVRQHVNRKHLAVQRDGRRVSVASDEAARWAHERGLPFNLPTDAWPSTATMEGRTARMTVLTQHRAGERFLNLLTVVRHRRRDALGPWSDEPGETWTSEDLGSGLRLYSMDASFEHCRGLVDYILEFADASNRWRRGALRFGTHTPVSPGLSRRTQACRRPFAQPVLQLQCGDHRVLELCGGSPATLAGYSGFASRPNAASTFPSRLPARRSYRPGREPHDRRRRGCNFLRSGCAARPKTDAQCRGRQTSTWGLSRHGVGHP